MTLTQTTTRTLNTSSSRAGRLIATAGLVAATGLMATTAQAQETAVAVTRAGALGGQSLVGLDTDSPTVPLFVRPITGIAAGQVINGLDYRPRNRTLYALASADEFEPGEAFTSQLYTIDVETGEATAVGGPIDPGLVVDNVDEPTYVGIDFNPVVDLIRAITSLDQNIVINTDTGALVVTATNTAYAVGDPNEGADPLVSSIAYTNSTACAESTQQYGIDAATDSLVTVANNAGTLGTVGSLNIPAPPLLSADVKGTGGLDISGDTDEAFALLTVELLDALGLPVELETQSLYSINLATGEATSLGLAGSGLLNLDGLTIMPVGPYCCPADIADDFGNLGPDGMVSFGDFLALLGLVGDCPGSEPGCTGDIADDLGNEGGDGAVSFGDFLFMLGQTGSCAGRG